MALNYEFPKSHSIEDVLNDFLEEVLTLQQKVILHRKFSLIKFIKLHYCERVSMAQNVEGRVMCLSKWCRTNETFSLGRNTDHLKELYLLL